VLLIAFAHLQSQLASESNSDCDVVVSNNAEQEAGKSQQSKAEQSRSEYSTDHSAKHGKEHRRARERTEEHSKNNLTSHLKAILEGSPQLHSEKLHRHTTSSAHNRKSIQKGFKVLVG
jgi:arylamine N-acetyltransferase